MTAAPPLWGRSVGDLGLFGTGVLLVPLAGDVGTKPETKNAQKLVATVYMQGMSFTVFTK